MGVKRVVDTGFWKDDVVAERFSAEDRYFFLYLLTNPNTKQCGIYHLPIRTIAFEMGYSRDSVESIIERFEQRFKNIIYNRETQEIAILNFLKHSIIKGGKPVEDCIKKELDSVKDKKLILAVYKNIEEYMNTHIKKNEKSMFKGIKEILLSYINENELYDIENDNDNERIVPRIVNSEIYSAEAVDLLQYWNSKNIIVHTMSDKIAKQIDKTLKEHSLEEVKLCIDRYHKVLVTQDYFFSAKWGLVEFLKQSNAMLDFKDGGSKWENYKASKAGKKEMEREFMNTISIDTDFSCFG